MPDAILHVPAVGLVVPLVWLLDASLIVPELDENFFRCLNRVRDGYKKMYPMLNFAGNVNVGRLVKFDAQNQEESLSRSLLFFSTGLDSYASLINHQAEIPDLATLWGSDVPLDDKQGWEAMQARLRFVEKEFGVRSFNIKTNFRAILDTYRCSRLVRKSGDTWWHGFQHVLTIITHAAALACHRGVGQIYIASSQSNKQVERFTCASDPLIDDCVEFAGVKIIHDAAELDRLDKARVVADFVQNKKLSSLPLHVCIRETEVNCSRCEKCLRTMLEFSLYTNDFKKLGFSYETMLQQNLYEILSDWSDSHLKVLHIPIYESIKERLNAGAALMELQVEYVRAFERLRKTRGW